MRAQRGFTLIELTITISIIGILAAFAMPAFIQTTRAYDGVSNNTKAADAMRNASMRIAREIREATPGTFTASANSLQFTRNDYYVTSSTTTATARTVYIAYDATGKQVNLYYSAPATGVVPLAKNVSGLSFVYYDSNNAVTTTASAIHFVEFTLTLTVPNPLGWQPPPTGQTSTGTQTSTSGQTVVQRTRVAVRNGL